MDIKKQVAESGNKDRKSLETCSKLGVLLSGLYAELFRGTIALK